MLEDGHLNNVEDVMSIEESGKRILATDSSFTVSRENKSRLKSHFLDQRIVGPKSWLEIQSLR